MENYYLKKCEIYYYMKENHPDFGRGLSLLENIDDYSISDFYNILTKRRSLSSYNNFVIYVGNGKVYFIRTNKEKKEDIFSLIFPITHPIKGKSMAKVIFKLVHKVCNHYEKHYLKADNETIFKKEFEQYGGEVKLNCTVEELWHVMIALQKISKALYVYEKEQKMRLIICY